MPARLDVVHNPTASRSRVLCDEGDQTTGFEPEDPQPKRYLKYDQRRIRKQFARVSLTSKQSMTRGDAQRRFIIGGYGDSEHEMEILGKISLWTSV